MRYTFTTPKIVLLLISLVCFNSVFSQTVYNESVSGDLSNNVGSPTTLNIPALVGTYQIVGSVNGSSDPQDNYNMIIPNGYQISNAVYTPTSGFSGSFEFDGNTGSGGSFPGETYPLDPFAFGYPGQINTLQASTQTYTVTFTIQSAVAGCTPPTAVTIGVTASPICPGSSTTLSVATGNLNDATAWKWYTVSCGGTAAGTGTSITVSPSVTTTYYVRGEGGCVTPGSCDNAVVTVYPASVGGTIAGSASYCVTGSGTLTLSGQTGSILRWEKSIDGGANWTTVANTTTTLNYTSLTTTTLYRAVVQSNSCAIVNSAVATITVSPTTVGGTVSPAAIAVCSGSNTGSLTLSGQTGSVIRWESSINGGTTWSPIANTTTSLTYTNISVPTLYRAVVQSGVCATANSANASMTVNTAGQWLGTVSSSWGNANNWACATLPTLTTDVSIPSSATFMPVVDGAGDVVRNLTIAAGGSVTFSGNNLLEIAGTFTNSGTFNPTNGSLKLSSAAAQSLPIGTYYDLIIAGAGTKTALGAVTVNHVLTLTTGKVDLGANNITLSSTGSITGGTSTSYILESGAGKLVQQGLGTGGRTGTILFPIGNNTSYTPLSINNTGVIDNFDARVIDNVYTTYTVETPGATPVTTGVVKKTWFINETTPGGSVLAITFQWNGADEATGFTRAVAYASHYNTALNSWQKYTNVGATGADPYVLTQTGITTFSPFGIASGFGPLPLQLLTFAGIQTSNQVNLDWSTTNEINVRNFTIERSVDNGPFTTIGTLNARNVSGNQAYQFLDADIAAQLWVHVKYQLKIVDADGRIAQSPTISFTNKKKQSILSLINPFKDRLQFTIKAAATSNCNIVLMDITGKALMMKNLTVQQGVSSMELNTSAIVHGTYILKVQIDKDVYTEKVIKVE